VSLWGLIGGVRLLTCWPAARLEQSRAESRRPGSSGRVRLKAAARMLHDPDASSCAQVRAKKKKKKGKQGSSGRSSKARSDPANAKAAEVPSTE